MHQLNKYSCFVYWPVQAGLRKCYTPFNSDLTDQLPAIIAEMFDRCSYYCEMMLMKALITVLHLTSFVCVIAFLCVYGNQKEIDPPDRLYNKCVLIITIWIFVYCTADVSNSALIIDKNKSQPAKFYKNNLA